MGADNSDELGILYGMPERWPLLHRFPKTNATRNFWTSNCDDLILGEATAL
jgi:hypothetical protein